MQHTDLDRVFGAEGFDGSRQGRGAGKGAAEIFKKSRLCIESFPLKGK